MKIIFAGTPDFAVPSLSALLTSSYNVVAVYTQPDRPAGRGQTLRASPIKLLAQQHDIPVYQPTTLRDPSTQQIFNNHRADIMVVAAYGLLLPKPILDAPISGCINVHASLLPRWRGAAPIQRAILAGDNKTGITIMQMAQGLDTGDMLYKTPCVIERNDTAQTLHDRLAILGASALMHALNLIKSNSIQPEPQNNDLACYAPKLTKHEAIINWEQSAEQISRSIRAYIPFPIAYTFLEHQQIRIWKAETLNEKTSLAPGTILQANAIGIDVATGNNTLRLITLQLAGGKPLSVKEILNARQEMFLPGKQFSCVT